MDRDRPQKSQPNRPLALKKTKRSIARRDARRYGMSFGTTNESQTLFGAEHVYLRHHMFDNSYMREWFSHRALARFGLPFLRTRTVQLYINDQKIAIYSLMESMTMEYVFHRSYPNYDPGNFGLFKMKTLSYKCGLPEQGYGGTAVANAEYANQSTKFQYDRGPHRPAEVVRGVAGGALCVSDFGKVVAREREDAVRAYKWLHDEDCSEMLVEQGIVDHDLGTDNWKDTMKDWLDDHYNENVCENHACANRDLAEDGDLNVDQFLKNLATMAAMVSLDSPANNQNNWFMANPGDGAEDRAGLRRAASLRTRAAATPRLGSKRRTIIRRDAASGRSSPQRRLFVPAQARAGRSVNTTTTTSWTAASCRFCARRSARRTVSTGPSCARAATATTRTR